MKRTDRAPFEYVEFVYRREMGYTPAELEEIPTQIIERDFFFMSRENMAHKAMNDG